MEEVDIYSFDGNNYILVEKIENYLYLSNENDDQDMLIRKEDPQDPELLLPLESTTEFQKALALFARKNGIEEQKNS